MDAELIKSIIAIIAPIITLIIFILTLLRGRIQKTNEPLDSSSIKIIKIKRYPLSKKEYRYLKIQSFFSKILLFIILISFNLYITLNLNTYITINTFKFAFIISDVIIFSIWIFYLLGISVYSMINPRRHSKIISNYDYFKNFDLIIEAEYDYIYNKCHEVLRAMGFKVVDLDEVAGTITASRVTLMKDTVDLRAKIEKVCNFESSYAIKLDFLNDMSVPVFSLASNQFINLLISKPKDEGGK